MLVFRVGRKGPDPQRTHDDTHLLPGKGDLLPPELKGDLAVAVEGTNQRYGLDDVVMDAPSPGILTVQLLVLLKLRVLVAHLAKLAGQLLLLLLLLLELAVLLVLLMLPLEQDR
jgi:hypothetical protein